jgi:hypothetical protein
MRVTAPIHTVLVIESLPADERQTGTELYNDVIKRYAEFYSDGDPISHRLFKVDTKKEFLEAIEYVIQNVKYYRRGVMLHIECHGLENRSGLCLADEASIFWSELKVPLIKINVGLDNELYVSMATCFGRYLHEAIDISMQSPFSGFLSASDIIWNRETLEDYSVFFEELVKTREIFLAEEVLSKSGSKFYYKDVETMFNELIVLTINDIRDDPNPRKEYFEACRQEYNKVRQPGFPEFDQMPVEQMFEFAKSGFVKKYRNNFLFGKYRK